MQETDLSIERVHAETARAEIQTVEATVGRPTCNAFNTTTN